MGTRNSACREGWTFPDRVIYRAILDLQLLQGVAKFNYCSALLALSSEERHPYRNTQQLVSTSI